RRHTRFSRDWSSDVCSSDLVSAQRRSTVLGLVTAAGSLGSVVAAPLGQILSDSEGWRVGVASFAVLASLMLPAAWLAGRVDRLRSEERRVGNVWWSG